MYIHLRPAVSLSVSFSLSYLCTAPPFLFYVRCISFSCHLVVPSVLTLFLFSPLPLLFVSDSSHTSRCTMDLHETPLWISIYLCSVYSLLYVTLNINPLLPPIRMYILDVIYVSLYYTYIYIYMHIRKLYVFLYIPAD